MNKTNKPDAALAQMRRICLALPDSKETPTWGKPHFRVKDKIFAGAEGLEIGFKTGLERQATLLADPRFRPAPYVGNKGWVTMDVSRVTDWSEVDDLVRGSYRLIAPKTSLAKLDGGAPKPAATKTTKKSPAKASKKAKAAKR